MIFLTIIDPVKNFDSFAEFGQLNRLCRPDRSVGVVSVERASFHASRMRFVRFIHLAFLIQFAMNDEFSGHLRFADGPVRDGHVVHVHAAMELFGSFPMNAPTIVLPIATIRVVLERMNQRPTGWPQFRLKKVGDVRSRSRSRPRAYRVLVFRVWFPPARVGGFRFGVVVVVDLVFDVVFFQAVVGRDFGGQIGEIGLTGTLALLHDFRLGGGFHLLTNLDLVFGDDTIGHFGTLPTDF